MKIGVAAVGVSCLFGLVAYFLLNNVVLTAILVVLWALSFYKWIAPSLLQAQEYLGRLDELYSFASSYVMQLAATPGAFEALQVCRPYFTAKVGEIADRYGDELEDFLNALDTFFKNKSYRVLAELVRIYEKDGGDIGKSSKSVIADIAFEKASAEELYRLKKRKAQEFLTMWIFAFASLIYLRVGLADYYLALLEKTLIVPVFLTLVLFIFSCFRAFYAFKTVDTEEKA